MPLKKLFPIQFMELLPSEVCFKFKFVIKFRVALLPNGDSLKAYTSNALTSLIEQGKYYIQTIITRFNISSSTHIYFLPYNIDEAIFEFSHNHFENHI